MKSSLIFLRAAGLLAGLAMVTAVQADERFPNFESYIKITGRAADVQGNASSFARRHQMPDNGSWGIEALRISKELNGDVSLSIDGKALLGKEDYLGKFKFVKSEVGTFEAGYKRYRTFYDGIGGFFPLNNRWMQLGNPELHTDRSKFWIDAKIERPDAPKFELRYTNEQRTGRKDTTIWGDTDFTGIPSYYGVGASAFNPPYSTNRKIVPNYIRLNERQQNWLGSVKHTVGNTDLELEVMHNTSVSHDRRTVSRYPGELQLFPRQSSSTNPPQVYPPATIGNEVQGYDQQDFDGTITSYTGKFETKSSDLLTVFGGVIYSDGSASIGGDRRMNQFIPTAVGIVSAIGGFVGNGRPPYSYTTTVGETNEQLLAANLGVKLTPSREFTTKLTLKHEKIDIDGFNTVQYISNKIDQTTGVITPVLANANNLADRTEKTWTPELDLRYTGFKGLSLYGTFDYRHSPGEEFGSSQGASLGGIVGSPVVSYTNVKLNHGHYKVGANWTVNQMLSLRGEIYYKDHTNGFYGFNTSAGDSYLLGYEFYGTKVTAVVKPHGSLSFTTRLVSQSGKMDTTVDGGVSMNSNDTTNYQFGETIDWSPSAETYVQANLNVVYHTIQTAYPVAGGLGNEVLRNADNNYINGSLVAGLAVNKSTDATLQYTYYRADNYRTPTYATVWYGAGVEEYTVSVGFKHRFNEKLVGLIRLGYVESENQTTGGNTNFHGPLAFISIEHEL